MEVKLDKRYPIAASPAQAWQVLSDLRATAACMPGAAITEQIDATHFKGTVKSKVGPAVMMFGGDIELLGVDAAAMELKMLGKGADKSGSSASMNLVAHLEPGAEASQSVLVGQATIIVSGKLAQFGSRLLVPVSDAMLGQFAGNFNIAAMAAPALAGNSAVQAQPLASAGPTPAPAPAPALGAASGPSPSPSPSPNPSPPQAAPVAPAVTELNALALLWTVVKAWFSGLFGKKA